MGCDGEDGQCVGEDATRRRSMDCGETENLYSAKGTWYYPTTMEVLYKAGIFVLGGT